MMVLKIKKSEMTRKMRARAVSLIEEGQDFGRGEQNNLQGITWNLIGLRKLLMSG